MEDRQFGPYRLAGPQGPLWKNATTIALAPKELAVLWHLVTHAGQVLSKAALFRAVWGETIVSDGALTVCLRRLREALGEDAAQPRYIATVHRVGYRFIAAVQSPESKVQGPEENQKSKIKTQKAKVEFSILAPNTQHLAPVLVGREAELTYLHNLFAKALNGERQLVFITGEAGIGKTALVDTFLFGVRSRTEFGVRSHEEFGVEKKEEAQRVKRKERRAKITSPPQTPNPELLSTPVLIGQGQCIEHYGTGEAYLPVLEALGRLCRQADGEQILSVLQRVAPSWLVQLPALLSEADYEASQQRVAGTTRERMLREIVAALEAISAERLLILVLEDVHWSDTSTVDLLSMLVRRRETARILMLATSRQAELVVSNHPLKTLKQELVTRGHAAEVLLGGLQVAAVQQYVGQRFVEQGTKAELATLVYRRTEGHPLFMVQLTDYLVQHHAQLATTPTALTAITQELPQGLRELIEVQVARLTPEEQRMLEAGSVAGVEFTIASVAATLGTRSDEAETLCEQLLQRGQFIVEREVSRWPDGTVSGQYGFRHALYQEVLYQRLSASRRVRLHQQIGEREEAGYGERASEIAAELAMHFERCLDAQRAVSYHTIAAQHAIQAHAHREALTHITSGLALIPQVSEPAVRTQRELVLQTMRGLSLVNTQGFGRPEVAEAYGRAHELSLQVANFVSLAPVLFGLWNFWFVHADLERARELAHQLDMLAQRQDDTAMQGKAHTMAGQTYTILGDFNAAFAHFRKGLAVYDEPQHSLLVRQYGEDAGVSSHGVMGSVCWALGYPDQARQHLLAGRQLAQRLTYPFLLVQNLWRSATVLQCCGATAEMGELLAMLLHEAKTIPFWHAGGIVLHGWTLVHQGHGERGILLMQEGMQAWRATGAEIARPYHLALLAHAYGMSGQLAAGLRSVDEALQLVASTGERWWEAEIYRLKGELTLARTGGWGLGADEEENQKSKAPNIQPLVLSTAEVEREVQECFLKAIDIARQQQAKSWELRAVMSLVRLRQQQARELGAENETAGKREGVEARRPAVRPGLPASQSPSGKLKEHEASTALAEALTMLSELYNWFTEGFDTKDLQEAKALIDSLESSF